MARHPPVRLPTPPPVRPPAPANPHRPSVTRRPVPPAERRSARPTRPARPVALPVSAFLAVPRLLRAVPRQAPPVTGRPLISPHSGGLRSGTIRAALHRATEAPSPKGPVPGLSRLRRVTSPSGIPSVGMLPGPGPADPRGERSRCPRRRGRCLHRRPTSSTGYPAQPADGRRPARAVPPERRPAPQRDSGPGRRPSRVPRSPNRPRLVGPPRRPAPGRRAAPGHPRAPAHRG
ncbi:hypothetical protein BC793_101437 [Actinoplanes xinjiangensis]|uniref:Uncharacterized protein n=1 Tax=Actinoplanes xinjiangensis TaxID=512350 RepID=A0A316FV17_9ACTN|nr:hypothetical protein BC793_101437 [Actinoplanes xinjiangensis]